MMKHVRKSLNIAFSCGIFIGAVALSFFVSSDNNRAFAYVDTKDINVHLYVMGCNDNSICEPITGETTESCPLDCPYVPVPTTTVSNIPYLGGGGSGSVEQIIFSNVVYHVGTSSATVNWYTEIPTVSVVSWGKGSEYEAGSISENNLRKDHTIRFDNLEPGTRYSISISALAFSGLRGSYTYFFITQPNRDVSAPANPRNFQAKPSFGGNILLTWTNPEDPDFAEVVITRGTRYFPPSPDVGFKVYTGNDSRTVDVNVNPNGHYFYTAFSKDTQGNYSAGALAEYEFSQSTSTSLYGGKTVIGTTTLAHVLFFQDTEQKYPINNQITVDQGKKVVIRIPAESVPKNADQSLVRVFDKDRGESTFLLSKKPDGSLEAIIPGFLTGGKNNFQVSFMGRGVETHVTSAFTVNEKPKSTSVGEKPLTQTDIPWILVGIVIFLVLLRIKMLFGV